jgi:hypothetical protein
MPTMAHDAAFKRKQQQEQEAKPKNPLMETATRFP